MRKLELLHLTSVSINTGSQKGKQSQNWRNQDNQTKQKYDHWYNSWSFYLKSQNYPLINTLKNIVFKINSFAWFSNLSINPTGRLIHCLDNLSSNPGSSQEKKFTGPQISIKSVNDIFRAFEKNFKICHKNAHL